MSQTFEVTCPHCGQRVTAAYADAPVQDLTCPHCARASCLFVRKQRFEVLFDLATAALLAGYAREAVSSFAAALERAFEFYVRAYALEQMAASGGQLEDASKRLSDTWRLVDRQSERQVGMFALAYLMREGKAPDFLKPQRLGSEFRNAVIHRGHLPATEEVQAYAAQVFAIIDGLLTDLGDATLQVQLLDELAFQQHFAALPEGTPAIIEEHSGVFRARMFGRFSFGGGGRGTGTGGPESAAWHVGSKGNRSLSQLLGQGSEGARNQTPSEVYRAALAYFGGEAQREARKDDEKGL